MADEENISEEEMAAQMAAMADSGEDGDGGDGGEDGHALSQDEIDNLLGFESADGGPKTGIEALLDRALLSYDRLPMLEVVFDHFVRTLSTSLRNFTSENVDVNLDTITSLRFEDYMNSVPLPAMINIFHAIEWENYGLIIIDSSLAYSMVDVLLGGGKSSRPIKIEGRPFTTIEQDIVKSLVDLMLEDLSSAFNPLTPANFRSERLETNPRFAAICRPANPVISISLKVEMDDRGGKAEIIFPYSTIEPIKDILTQMFTGEDFGNDNSWESYLSSEVQNTIISLKATLDEKAISLKELASLKVGSTIITNNTPTDDVNMECNGIKVMSGKIGSSGNNMAIKIDEIFHKEIDEEILG
jgi:flagellar motor switch protein FliM